MSQRWTSKFNRRVNKIFSVLGFHCIFPLPKVILVQLKRIPVFKGIIHLDSSTWAVLGATANLVGNHDLNVCKQNTAVAWQPDNYRVRTQPHSDFNGLFGAALHHFFGPQMSMSTLGFALIPKRFHFTHVKTTWNDLKKLNTMPWVN